MDRIPGQFNTTWAIRIFSILSDILSCHRKGSRIFGRINAAYYYIADTTERGVRERRVDCEGRKI